MTMERWRQIQDNIWKCATDSDTYAKLSGTLEGRYIREPIADGFSYYEIVEERPRTVVVKHIDIGDGWTIPFIEALNGTIPKKYVVQNIEQRDRTDDFINHNRGAA